MAVYVPLLESPGNSYIVRHDSKVTPVCILAENSFRRFSNPTPTHALALNPEPSEAYTPTPSQDLEEGQELMGIVVRVVDEPGTRLDPNWELLKIHL